MKGLLRNFKDLISTIRNWDVKNWLILLVLVSGLAVTVYLVQVKQILKSRAQVEMPQVFEVTQTAPDGSQSQVDYNYFDQSYHVNSLKVKVKIKDLQGLIQ